MCFSAGASITAGIVLTGVGVASLRQASNIHEKAFAGIPLLFAVQQFAEGVLWLALSDPNLIALKPAAMYVFLFFAQFLWPFWVPFSILILSRTDKYRKVKIGLMIIGLVVSVNLGVNLLLYPVDAHIADHHILYQLDFPKAIGDYRAGLYLIATIAPPFFSGLRKMWILSTAIFISYIISMILYREFVISVWCFFAAVISIVVLYIMREVKRSSDMPQPG